MTASFVTYNPAISSPAPVAQTVADIKSLYTSIVSFIQSCNATLDSTLANIASSTDYSNCISYVWVTP